MSGYRTVSFLNSSTGWASIGGSIYKTNGNINNWVNSTIAGVAPAAGAILLFPVSSAIVYAALTDGRVLKSTYGGINFLTQYSFSGTPLFHDIHFIDANTGYASYETRIYKTTDGGTNWQIVVALGTALFSEIHFTDAAHGWGCTNDGSIIKLN